MFWRPPSWRRFCCAACATRCFCGPQACLLAAVAIWAAVKKIIAARRLFCRRPGQGARWTSSIRHSSRAKCYFCCSATLAGYGVVFLVAARLAPAKAHIYAAAIVAVALAAYWILVRSWRCMPPIAITCARCLSSSRPCSACGGGACDARRRSADRSPFRGLPRIMTALSSRAAARAVAGAFVLVMLVHAVETAKFVTAWTKYKAAVRGARHRYGVRSGARRSAFCVVGAHWRRSQPAVLVFDDALSVRDPGASSRRPGWWSTRGRIIISGSPAPRRRRTLKADARCPGGGPQARAHLCLPASPLAHDPKKLVLDLVGDGNRFSEKIMRKQNVREAQ